MTYEEIADMAEECGFPVAYDHFAEGESPDPPFLVFLLPADDSFSADGIAYVKITELNFELYTDMKDPEAEKKVEDILESHGVYYTKSEVWIPDEKMYEVLYQMEVTYGEEE